MNRIANAAAGLVILAVAIGGAGLASAQQSAGAATTKLPDGTTPPDVFGPAQVQLLEDCIVKHAGNNNAVGDCVAQGLARQWADYAVGRPTRECIENRNKCTLGRLLTNPRDQIAAWRERYAGKFRQLQRDAQNLINTVRDPKAELRTLERRLAAEVAGMQTEAGRWVNAVANAGQTLKAFEHEAKAKVNAALDDLHSTRRDLQAKVDRAASEVGRAADQVARTGTQITDAVRRGRDALRGEIKRLKDDVKLPAAYLLEAEISKADTEAAINSLGERIKRESAAFVAGKPTTAAAAAIAAAAQAAADAATRAARQQAAEVARGAAQVRAEFDRLMDEGLLPDHFRLNLPENPTQKALQAAEATLRATAAGYKKILAEAEAEARRLATETAAKAATELKRLRDHIKDIKAQGLLRPDWILHLPDAAPLEAIEGAWRAVEQTSREVKVVKEMLDSRKKKFEAAAKRAAEKAKVQAERVAAAAQRAAQQAAAQAQRAWRSIRRCCRW